MAEFQPEDLAESKRQLRIQGKANRRRQQQKEATSAEIIARLRDLPEYRAARQVLFYIDVGDEVQTRQEVASALRSGTRVAVPYCLADHLELYQLAAIDELNAGRYGILEPRQELRKAPGKTCAVSELDLILVPGVAFDRRGARLGRGRGYYDRLLEHAGPQTVKVGLAYECQMFPAIPTAPHDVLMDKVITERQTYKREGV